ncbi:MFS transporter [Streptodolium elevatio]|uniref:MFS transporter n=1 Tax=Streptodolium elevatio TaxID=3157996 RepID=A0ABV3DE23_9ACTN
MAGKPQHIGSTAAGLTAMTVSFGLNFSAGVFFAPVAAEYGIGTSTLAITAAVSTVLTGLVQPLVGALLDRVGAKRVIVAALALLSGSYLALGAARETWQFVAAYVLLGGLGFAGASSLAVSTLIARDRGERAAPALARAAVGINLGQLIVPWAATVLFDAVGLRGTYAIVGAAGFAATLALAAVMPPDVRPERPGTAQPLLGRARVLAAFGLHSATLYAMVLLLPKHAAELGWDRADAGRLVVVAAAAAAVSSATVPRLLAHRTPEQLLVRLHLIRAVSLVLAAAASDAALLVVAALLFGVSSFTVVPLTMAVVTRGLDPARLGRSLAPAWLIHQAAAGLGLAVAAAGHALTGDYRAYFALGVGLSLLAAALIAAPATAVRPSPARAGH